MAFGPGRFSSSFNGKNIRGKFCVQSFNLNDESDHRKYENLMNEIYNSVDGSMRLLHREPYDFGDNRYMRVEYFSKEERQKFQNPKLDVTFQQLFQKVEESMKAENYNENKD